MRPFSLPLRPANAWSNDEVRRLRQLAVDGASLDMIATTLRRTRSAVRNKATMHGISLKSCGSSAYSSLSHDSFPLPATTTP